MPLSSKRFIISTSNLNSQGFRMLTTGAILEPFKKNPLMLFNHIRPEGNLKNQILPIGHWQDIEVNGDEISGVPYFDDKDEFAMTIFHKVEGGHIRMCSAGAEPIETSKKKSDLLPGQKLASVSKWILKEASICDIGANPDALDVALYDSSDRLIKLSETSIENFIPKITTMSKKTTTAGEALSALKKAQEAKKTAADAIKLAQSKISIALADEETSEEEKTQLSEGAEETEELSDEDKDAKIEELKKTLADTQAQLAKLHEDAKLAEEAEEDKKATALADKAYNQRKIKLSGKDGIITLAKANMKKAEEFVAGLPVLPSVKGVIENSSKEDHANDEIVKLSQKSFDELFKLGKVNEVKLNAPEAYKKIYKAKFGKDPRNV